MPDPSSASPEASRGPRFTDGALTVLLNAAGEGDRGAMERVLGIVYDELRAIAQNRMKQERASHTLQATALVNEAYLRLLGSPDAQWAGRGHFFRAAAEAMRKILIDHARSRNAEKRGGGKSALSITGIADLAAAEETDPAGILALDDAIVRLEQVDAQSAAVVRLRFYGGLPEHAVGDALGISERTVRRDWAFARGWLRDHLEREAAGGGIGRSGA